MEIQSTIFATGLTAQFQLANPEPPVAPLRATKFSGSRLQLNLEIPLLPSRSATLRPPLKRQKPRRAARRRHWSWRARLILLAVLAGCATTAWAFIARVTAPDGNTSQSRFDAIIVLGGGVDSDGNLKPGSLARTTEAVREYERGIAPRLIFSGGLDYGTFDEAVVMARAAQAQGVPQSAILLERKASDTIQNACFTTRMMKQHGWTSAEIVTSPSHLPRAGIIFSKTPIAWRMHAAPPMEQPSSWDVSESPSIEFLKTIRYLLYADWAERCSP